MGATHLSAVSSTLVPTSVDCTADVVFTTQQAADTGIIRITAGTGKKITYPAAIDGKVVQVTNGGTGAITVLVSGGTGVAVANGKSAILQCNATDFVRVTADA